MERGNFWLQRRGGQETVPSVQLASLSKLLICNNKGH